MLGSSGVACYPREKDRRWLLVVGRFSEAVGLGFGCWHVVEIGRGWKKVKD